MSTQQVSTQQDQAASAADLYIDMSTGVEVAWPGVVVAKDATEEAVSVHKAHVTKLPRFPAELQEARHDVLGFVSDWVAYCTQSSRAEKYMISDWVALMGRSVEREIDFQNFKDPANEVHMKERSYANRHQLMTPVVPTGRYPIVHDALRPFLHELLKWLSAWNVAAADSTRPKKFQICSFLNAMCQTVDREITYVRRQHDAIALRVQAEKRQREE